MVEGSGSRPVLASHNPPEIMGICGNRAMPCSLRRRAQFPFQSGLQALEVLEFQLSDRRLKIVVAELRLRPQDHLADHFVGECLPSEGDVDRAPTPCVAARFGALAQAQDHG